VKIKNIANQKFIEQQSHMIDNWPDWKKNVLGRIDLLDERVKISKRHNEQPHNSEQRRSSNGGV
jgi:hypothetical protein